MSAVNATGWSGTIDLGVFLLWLAVPPLVVWIVWLWRHPVKSADRQVNVRELNEPLVDSFGSNAAERAADVPDAS